MHKDVRVAGQGHENKIFSDLQLMAHRVLLICGLLLKGMKKVNPTVRLNPLYCGQHNYSKKYGQFEKQKQKTTKPMSPPVCLWKLFF